MVNEAPARKRRERGSITPDEILEGAFAVAERDSLDNLSMPELARYLDVGVTSIYWYFRKKEDLLRMMNDEAIRAVRQLLPSTNTALGWRDFLDEYYTAMRQVYRSNDVLADLVLVRMNTYSLSSVHDTYESVERIVRLLVTAGFDPLTAWNANSALYTFTRGAILSERTQRLQNAATLDERQSRLIVPETMPLLAELYREEGISLSMTSEDNFRFGLTSFLDHFEHLLQRIRQTGG